METVYDESGECLGEEWVDLSGLQEDTRAAILQMIDMDETIDILHRTFASLKAKEEK